MNGIDLEQLLKSALSAIKIEDLVVEAMRETFKDEIKRHIQQKLEENPELRAEAKAALNELIQAKIKETYAIIRLGKVATALGVTMVPGELREQVGRELVSLVEREVSQVMEKL